MTIHSRLLQIPLTSGSGDGWTIFTETAPSGQGDAFVGAGTREIYVSSSTGSDSNHGTLASPYATIAKGLTAVRTGKPDWLLLKCGDTFTNDDLSGVNFAGPGMLVSPAWTTAGTHTVSGVILLGTYGTGNRPIVRSTVAFAGSTMITITGARHMDNVAVVGWEFYAYSRDPSSGSYNSADDNADFVAIYNLVQGSNFILEDCKFSYFSEAMVLQINNYDQIWNTFICRRNIIVDQYSTAGRPQGFFTAGWQNVLIEENLFDHNGWNTSVTGANQSTLCHNLYQAIPGSDANTIVRGNIFTNDAGGVQFRAGGTIYNNFFAQCASHLLSAVNTSTISYNVIQQACDITGVNASVQGWGIGVNYGAPGTLIDNNIIANENSTANGSGDFGINLDNASNSTTGHFTNSSNSVTAVADGGAGSGNGSGIEGWPVGTIINCAAAGLASNTVTVTARSGFDDQGTPGTLTLSANATATGTFTIVRNLINPTVSNNIVYKQKGGIQDNNSNGTATLTNNVNDPTGTNFSGFPNPNITIATYDTSIGGSGSLTDFLTVGKARQRGLWPTNYTANTVNNYFRAGYGRSPL